MANNIALFKEYIELLDEVYKQSSLTAGLDGAQELVKAGANANELVIPMINVDGLADYDRNGGYVGGDVELTNETVKCNFDRGRKFVIDAMDNVETAGIAFGKLSSEFIRTKVVPELDAFRLSTYSQKAGTKATGALTTGDQVVKALREATNAMDELEVPVEGRELYITPSLRALVDDLDTTKSRAVMARFSKIVSVPQTRFYTEIKQNNGKTEGELIGGYTKAESGAELNFVIVHNGAQIQFDKRAVTKAISPEDNTDSDGWIFAYRHVAIADVYANKTAGVYSHAKA